VVAPGADLAALAAEARKLAAAVGGPWPKHISRTIADGNADALEKLLCGLREVAAMKQREGRP
jgi:hypothetical protein